MNPPSLRGSPCLVVEAAVIATPMQLQQFPAKALAGSGGESVEVRRPPLTELVSPRDLFGWREIDESGNSVQKGWAKGGKVCVGELMGWEFTSPAHSLIAAARSQILVQELDRRNWCPGFEKELWPGRENVHPAADVLCLPRTHWVERVVANLAIGHIVIMTVIANRLLKLAPRRNDAVSVPFPSHRSTTGDPPIIPVAGEHLLADLADGVELYPLQTPAHRDRREAQSERTYELDVFGGNAVSPWPAR